MRSLSSVQIHATTGFAMRNRISPSSYAAHLDKNKAHHLAFLNALLERVDKLDPEALQEGGDLRDIWKAAVESKAPLMPEGEEKPAAGDPGGAETSWEAILEMAKSAGARYPELVAAQWALESGWGKSVSGKNNFFGLKGSGTKHQTQEFVDGKWITIVDEFIDFDTPDECVIYLVDRWYKDFKGYKGVNNASTLEGAAQMLETEGYATDPSYSNKLLRVIREKAGQEDKNDNLNPAAPASPATALKADAGKWKTRVQALNLSQPDASTCQAACIAMAVGDKNIMGIRKKLLALGDAGNPFVMSKMILQSYKVNYIFEPNATLEKVCGWLKEGELLITHGWFTGSGHVIILDGLVQNSATKAYSFDVKDPWSEFDGSAWKYNKSSKFYDGFYSANTIYAACVAGTSVNSAASIYKSRKIDMNKGGMWVHRFWP